MGRGGACADVVKAAARPPHSKLEFAEGYCYRAPGGAHGWGKSA